MTKKEPTYTASEAMRVLNTANISADTKFAANRILVNYLKALAKETKADDE